MGSDKENAFVLRVSPGGIDMLAEALSSNQIIIGWSKAEGLLDKSLTWEDFRDIVSSAYYSAEDNMRRAGGASGNMWRFIRDMNEGDLVVVPHGSQFYVARITGPAKHDKSKIEEGSAYRRDVTWLNSKNSIPRMLAKSALISRMKTQGTCVYASDIIDDIRDSLKVTQLESAPTFQSDLQARLIRETLMELHSGRIESYGFERLIQATLLGLGAKEVRIVPRSQDKGADLLATFIIAGAIEQIVAVQAKHWQASPPVSDEVVRQLVRGIEAESANLGIIITSGTISDAATKAAQEYYDEKGIRIELVDGEQFAKLIVEHGIKVE